MSDEDPNYTPQPADKVARRALALCALSCRGFIDNGKANPDAEHLHQRIIQWIQRLELTSSLSSYELKRLQAPLGSLEKEQSMHMGWEVQSVAVFAWALGHADLPSHAQKVDPYTTTDTFFFLSDDAADLITSAALRSAHQLDAYRELMYAIDCRMAAFCREAKEVDFTTWIEQSWLDDLGIAPTRIVADEDLCFDGVPLIQMPREKIPTLGHLIAQQHRASIWLRGEENLHWETTADV